ncbi:MAG: capsular polysaccharide biosynthesis protein [Clostridia bacterium]|nr:capsular polysaccharide biosynthesis protein [Clostridia bacterium]
MIDFHTHILPEIDDGSSSVTESVELLKMLRQQGVSKVVLTPHFYAYSSSAESFLKMRQESLGKLVKALGEESVDIDLYLGCEVLYFEELWRLENLDSYCIEGTRHILIEMPFSPWADSMIDGIEKIITKGYIPIIAHFERYLGYQGNKKKVEKLLSMGALLQINCEFLNRFLTRGKAAKLIRKGYISALGTDCHNIGERAPKYDIADAYLRKKLSSHRYERFQKRQRRILSGAEKVIID